MKIKIFFLMTMLIVIVIIAIVLPLTQLGNYVLIKLSKDSTENAISILSNTAGGGFYQYISGTKKEKRVFKLTLQEGLMSSAKNWADIKELFVIDKNEEIIAHSQPRLIGEKYNAYKNMPDFKKKTAEIIAPYIKKINLYNINILKNKNSLQKLNKKLKKLEKSIEEKKIESQNKNEKKSKLKTFFLIEEINKRIKRIEVYFYKRKTSKIKSLKIKQRFYNKEISTLTNEIKNIEKKIKEIEGNPLIALENPIQINTEEAYTIIYPIKLIFGEKSKTVGIFFATISTKFIKNILFWAIVISIAISIFVLIISFWLIHLFTKIIINPIIILTDGVKQVTDGNFNMKIPVKGKDQIATLSREFNNMIRIWREKLMMEKYVSKSTASMIKKLKTGKFIGIPQKKFITIFFSDIRGFTAYSENHDPLNVINSINSIFDIQVDIINKYDGDIDKFVGDEIMAQFPSPLKAFKASLEIQKKMNSFNAKRKEQLEIGIGINYGEAIVGAIGGKDSLDWTAIGDTVNLGARLCGIAPGGKIVISDTVYPKFKISLKPIEKTIQVKGKRKKIKVYVF